MPDKSSAKAKKVNAVTDVAINWKRALLDIAEPDFERDNKESLIARAAARAGIPFRTARGLFYGEIEDPKWSVGKRIEQALQKQRALRDEPPVIEARNEYTQLRERISRIEALLLADKDSGGPAMPQRR